MSTSYIDPTALVEALKHYRTLSDAARLLGVAPTRVAAMRREGLIVGLPTPLGYVFSLDEINRAKTERESRRAARAKKLTAKEE